MSGLAEDFGVKIAPKIIPEETPKKVSISPFAFVDEIYLGKKNIIIDAESEKQYNAFMVNLTLSFGPDTILQANEMNQRWQIDKKMQNDYLLASIIKKKRFNKWQKKEKQNKDIDTIKAYYGYNTARAIDTLKILTPEQIQAIENRLDVGGS